MLNTALVVLYQALTMAVVFGLWRYRQASPIFWFPLALALMAVGSLVLMDLSLPADRTYAALYFLALLSFAGAAWLCVGATNLPARLEWFANLPDQPDTSQEMQVSVALFAFCVLVTVLYYYQVGYNVFVLLLQGEVDDYSTARIAAYSGQEYFAPGYVNQFKNVLLPITALSIGASLARRQRKGALLLFSALAVPFTIIAIAGTGQRAFVVYTFAGAIFGLVLHNAGRGRAIKRRHVAMAAAPVIAIFTVMTAAYTSTGDDSFQALKRVIDRFVFIQQDGGLLGFRYIYYLDKAWFSEWGQGLAGVLPGHEGSTLDHELHALIYGSLRGTAPLTSVGSAYYNGGVVGVILLLGAQGFAYAWLYVRFLGGRRTRTRSFAYGFLFFYLSAYVAGSPVILLDNGVLTILLFLLLIRPGAHRPRLAVR